MRDRLLLILVVLSCVSAWAQEAQNPAPPTNATATVNSAPAAPAIDPGFFGIHVTNQTSNSALWPTVPFGALRLWDVSMAWNDLEPSSGTYNWANLDEYLNLAQQHSVDVLYVFGHTPAWASSGSDPGCQKFPQSCFPPTKMQDWDNFVTAIATHAAGRIRYWELWDEANTPNHWRGDTATLVKMASDAYNIIKSVDPSAVVLSPSVSGLPPGESAFLNQYFSQGGGPVTDVVDFHAHKVDINNPDTIVGFVSSIKAVLALHGLAGKPIWDTEGGWRPQDANFELDPRSAGYVAREFFILNSNSVARLYWYSWSNKLGWGTMWTQTGGINAAGVAYGQVYNWLVGAVMSPCVEGVDLVWTCVLTRAGGFQGLIVWNSAGTIRSYTPPSLYKQYLNLSGGKGVIRGPVTIGYNPILLTN
jgi:hypothetical protein